MEPPPLGVTLKNNGCDFDTEPPGDVGIEVRGRPLRGRDKALAFLRDALVRDNDQIATDLRDQWIDSGRAESAYWRAIRELKARGELVAEGGSGTRQKMILHLIRGESASQLEGENVA
jgi:hypothetical protein